MKLATGMACLMLAACLGAQDLPTGGTSVISADPLTALSLEPNTSTFANHRVEGGVLKVDVHTVPQNYWNVQYKWLNVIPIAKDDVVFVAAKVRVTEAANETGKGFIAVSLQRSSPPWDGALQSVEVEVGKEWMDVYGVIYSPADFAPGQVQFPLNLGWHKQKVELRDLRILNYGKGFDTRKLPFMRFTYPGRELNAPWRKAARARIEQLRKSGLTVKVLDRNGRPVSGATVDISQTRHKFFFGTVVNSWVHRGSQREDTPESKRYLDFIFDKGLFNRIVFEGEMKWVNGIEDHPEWFSQRVDDIMARARRNGFDVRGHTVLWPGWTTGPWDIMPRRLRPLVESGNKEAVAKEINDRADFIVKRYQGQISDWDVINEAVAHRVIEDFLGTEYLASLFKRVRSADPKAKLYINDFSMLSGGAIEKPRIDGYYALIKRLLAAGAPIDGIGEQGHFGTTVVAPERMLSILDRFAQFKLPIQITEFDVAAGEDEDLQADFVRDFYTVAFSHPSVNGITMWGFKDGAHWQPSAGLWRDDYSPKKAGKVYENLLKSEWRTEAQLRTDRRGQAMLRGFHGSYRIQVRRGKQTKIENVTLSRAGKTVTVRLD